MARNLDPEIEHALGGGDWFFITRALLKEMDNYALRNIKPCTESRRLLAAIEAYGRRCADKAMEECGKEVRGIASGQGQFTVRHPRQIAHTELYGENDGD
jgi:hypothetical protein